ncbi:MAG: hypothetical protein ACW99E_16250 [Promethearchaeota archaeon]
MSEFSYEEAKKKLIKLDNLCFGISQIPECRFSRFKSNVINLFFFFKCFNLIIIITFQVSFSIITPPPLRLGMKIKILKSKSGAIYLTIIPITTGILMIVNGIRQLMIKVDSNFKKQYKI